MEWEGRGAAEEEGAVLVRDGRVRSVVSLGFLPVLISTPT